MRRALVNDCGLFYCGYNAGVERYLFKKLGPNYFQERFSSSGSIFASTYCAAGLPAIMEGIWRNDVCDGQLLKWKKFFRGKALDLDYLIGLFQSPDRRLDLDALFQSESRVTYVLTEYDTGQPVFVQPIRTDIWRLMRAACAMPLLHSPVETDHGLMVDGGLSMPCPVQQALMSGADEVVVISNKPEDHVCRSRDTLACSVAGLALPSHLRRLLMSFEERRLEIEHDLFAHPRVRVIRPKYPLPIISSFDGNKQRLNKTIDRGVLDARRYVRRLSP